VGLTGSHLSRNRGGEGGAPVRFFLGDPERKRHDRLYRGPSATPQDDTLTAKTKSRTSSTTPSSTKRRRKDGAPARTIVINKSKSKGPTSANERQIWGTEKHSHPSYLSIHPVLASILSSHPSYLSTALFPAGKAVVGESCGLRVAICRIMVSCFDS
jgi:hypothetical protein